MDLGQFFITGISGIELTSEESSFIESEKIGGIILFSHNYKDPAQLCELINNIQKLRDEYPLFISIDHEGGRVQRFRDQFTHFPPMLEIAKLNSPKLIFEVHQVMARELKAVGFNLSYSPVCDILFNEKNSVIGDRAFGTDPEEVTKFVSAAIRGLQTENILACPKHFPGHGRTIKDSHFDLPILKTSLEEIIQTELPPFVKASKSRIEFMMMAHLQVDSIDNELPTSVSEKAYNFLRDTLKYQNLIITDDMDMKAIADRYSHKESGVMALKAGADIIIHREFENTKEALSGLKDAVHRKVIKNEDLIKKERLISKCKKNHLSNYRPIYIPSIKKDLKNQEAQVLLEKITKQIEEQT